MHLVRHLPLPLVRQVSLLANPSNLVFRSSETGKLLDMRLQIQVAAVADYARRMVAPESVALQPTVDDVCERHLIAFDSTRSSKDTLSWSKALEMVNKYSSTTIHELSEEVMHALEAFDSLPSTIDESLLRAFVTSRLRMQLGAVKEAAVLQQFQRTSLGADRKVIADGTRHERCIAQFNDLDGNICNVSLSGRFDGIVVPSNTTDILGVAEIDEIVEVKYRCGIAAKHFHAPSPFDRKWYEAQIQSYFLLLPKCHLVHLVC